MPKPTSQLLRHCIDGAGYGNSRRQSCDSGSAPAVWITSTAIALRSNDRSAFSKRRRLVGNPLAPCAPAMNDLWVIGWTQTAAPNPLADLARCPTDSEVHMITLYSLKPGFQKLLRPIARWLHDHGVSANQVTIAALSLSLATGAAL